MQYIDPYGAAHFVNVQSRADREVSEVMFRQG